MKNAKKMKQLRKHDQKMTKANDQKNTNKNTKSLFWDFTVPDSTKISKP